MESNTQIFINTGTSLSVSRAEEIFLREKGFDLDHVYRVRDDVFTDGKLILSRAHRLTEREVDEFDSVVQTRGHGFTLHYIGNTNAAKSLAVSRRRVQVEFSGGSSIANTL